MIMPNDITILNLTGISELERIVDTIDDWRRSITTSFFAMSISKAEGFILGPLPRVPKGGIKFSF